MLQFLRSAVWEAEGALVQEKVQRVVQVLLLELQPTLVPATCAVPLLHANFHAKGCPCLQKPLHPNGVYSWQQENKNQIMQQLDFLIVLVYVRVPQRQIPRENLGSLFSAAPDE